MYAETTRNIQVAVDPLFMDEESSPEEEYYVWTYTVRIENKGAETVQLRTRMWEITDGTGQCERVQGVGVVGEEPYLQPGEIFEYTSGAPLATPSGIMSGAYTMETQGGERFDVKIPPFSLDSPHEMRRIH
jgi:ApaG protein